MDFNLENVGCRQTATKNTIKTAKIQVKTNSLKATRHYPQYCCGSYSSVWPKDNKNNNKISTQRQLKLLLITVTVSMTFLQMPSATSAAAAAKTAQLHFDSDNRMSRSSGSNIDDFVKDHVKNDDIRVHHSIIPRRSRLRKRHSEYLYLQRHLEESATNLEWLNPCNGFFDASSETSESAVAPSSYFLKMLGHVLYKEFHTINNTMNEIETKNIGRWLKTYKEFYSFLPKVQLNSKIILKTWYSDLQVFIATFAKLGRMQYKFDRAKHMSTSPITNELNDLLLSARRILCEIETTINGSYPFPTNQHKMVTYSRAEMNELLRLVTIEHAGPHRRNDLLEPEMIDLQFAKFKYINNLRRIWRVLRRRSKRHNRKSANLPFSLTAEDNSGSSASWSGSSSSSASGSIEFSFENGSFQRSPVSQNKRNRRQRKTGHKSAQLPK